MFRKPDESCVEPSGVTVVAARVLRILKESEQIPNEALESLQNAIAAGQGLKNTTATVIETAAQTGMVSAEQVMAVLAKACGMECIDLERIEVPSTVLDSCKPEWARRYRVFPFSATDATVHLAVSDPFAVHILDALSNRISKMVYPYLARADAINCAIERYYPTLVVTEEVLRKQKPVSAVHLSSVTSTSSANAEPATPTAHPVIRYIHKLIDQAVERHASDIHIEPLSDRLHIRYRIDGVLYEIESNADPNLLLHSSVISRIKLMAELDIAEKRRPQDGRIHLTNAGPHGPLDMRISILPTVHGESVVLRLLDAQELRPDMSDLGFYPDDHAIFKRLINLPDGMLLVTGPTGSGKTTTLYSALASLNQTDRKIITVEDPVEYAMSSITQVSVKAKAGVTFAGALRAILRQAPNVIMIGEIRDAETAQIAVNAALTGHSVYSTLHTNDAIGTVARLRNLNIELYVISAALRGVLNQRLVRKLCLNCRRPYTPSMDEWAALGLYQYEGDNASFMSGSGCRACNHSGFHGRLGIFELFIVDETLQQMLYEGAEHATLLRQARQNGMITLIEDGIRKAAAGLTTLREILSVTVDKQNSCSSC